MDDCRECGYPIHIEIGICANCHSDTFTPPYKWDGQKPYWFGGDPDISAAEPIADVARDPLAYVNSSINIWEKDSDFDIIAGIKEDIEKNKKLAPIKDYIYPIIDRPNMPPKLMKWIVAELTKDNSLIKDEGFKKSINEILEIYPKKRDILDKVDINKDSIINWVDTYYEKYSLDGRGEKVYDFGNGWSVLQLTTNSQLKYESDNMRDEDGYGHCLGSEGHGHPQKIKKGLESAYSIRDPENKPHVTILVNPKNKTSIEVRGPGNQDPPKDMMELVRQFYAHMDDKEGWHLLYYPGTIKDINWKTIYGSGEGSINPGETDSTMFNGRMLEQAISEGISLEMAYLYGADLYEADLSGVNLSGANLSKAELGYADLSGANLSEADLSNVDLSGANLSGVNLSGVNLSDASLGRADLSGVNLRGVNLSGADLSGANLSGANLSYVDLSGAILSETILTGAILSGAILYKTNLCRANLSEADLSKADLNGADLYEANLSGANLSGAKLNGAILSKAILYEASLSGASLTGIDFSGAYLALIDLSGVNLRGVSLSGAKLFGANLSGADLSYVDLSEADLSGANLSKAILYEANLSGADLSYVDLSEASLRAAILYEASLSGASLTGIDFSGADLSGVNLSGAILNGVSLSGAKLFGANLSEADLSKADLSGANLNGANLSKADLSGANLTGAYLNGVNLMAANFYGARYSESTQGLNDEQKAVMILCDEQGNPIQQAPQPEIVEQPTQPVEQQPIQPEIQELPLEEEQPRMARIWEKDADYGMTNFPASDPGSPTDNLKQNLDPMYNGLSYGADDAPGLLRRVRDRLHDKTRGLRHKNKGRRVPRRYKKPLFHDDASHSILLRDNNVNVYASKEEVPAIYDILPGPIPWAEIPQNDDKLVIDDVIDYGMVPEDTQWKICAVPLKLLPDIHFEDYDDETGSRDREYVEDLAAAIKSGEVDMPLMCFLDKDGGVILVDGYHRTAALNELGYEYAKAYMPYEDKKFKKIESNVKITARDPIQQIANDNGWTFEGLTANSHRKYTLTDLKGIVHTVIVGDNRHMGDPRALKNATADLLRCTRGGCIHVLQQQNRNVKNPNVKIAQPALLEKPDIQIGEIQGFDFDLANEQFEQMQWEAYILHPLFDDDPDFMKSGWSTHGNWLDCQNFLIEKLDSEFMPLEVRNTLYNTSPETPFEIKFTPDTNWIINEDWSLTLYSKSDYFLDPDYCFTVGIKTKVNEYISHIKVSEVKPVIIKGIHDDAKKVLHKFWEDHPDLRKGCLDKYGYDPIDDELPYWYYGLAEPEHHMILEDVLKNDGFIDLEQANRWTKSELAAEKKEAHIKISEQAFDQETNTDRIMDMLFPKDMNEPEEFDKQNDASAYNPMTDQFQIPVKAIIERSVGQRKCPSCSTYTLRNCGDFLSCDLCPFEYSLIPDKESNNVADNDSSSRYIQIDHVDLGSSLKAEKLYQDTHESCKTCKINKAGLTGYCPSCNEESNRVTAHIWEKEADITQNDISDSLTNTTDLHAFTDDTLADLRSRDKEHIKDIESFSDEDGNVYFVYSDGKIHWGKSIDNIISQHLNHKHDTYTHPVLVGSFNLETKKVRFESKTELNQTASLKQSFLSALKRNFNTYFPDIDYPNEDILHSDEEIYDVKMGSTKKDNTEYDFDEEKDSESFKSWLKYFKSDEKDSFEWKLNKWVKKKSS